jgi:hypothetical protein
VAATRAAGSTVVSRPARLRIRPSTTTVSTSAAPAASASTFVGSVNGAVPTWSTRTRIRSARLPGVSEPVTSPSPSDRAASTVDSSSIRLVPTASSCSAPARSSPVASRIADQRSAVPVRDSVSTESVTSTPLSSISFTGGIP